MHPGERSALMEKIKPGFLAELHARKAFKEAGFNLSTHYYVDAEGFKSREIDILAVRKVDTRYSQFVHIVVGEVKHGYTWICGDDSPPDRTEPSAVEVGRPEWFKKLRVASSSEAFSLATDFLPGLDLMAPLFATSMHPIGQDSLYEAVTTLVKAVASLEPPLPDNRHFWVAVPLLILDGNLLGVEYGSDGQMTLGPRDHVQYGFTFASPGYPKVERYIHIVTLDALPGFLRRILEAEDKASELANQLYLELHRRPAEESSPPIETIPASP